MSLLSGLFQTADVISAIGKALDPSHHPFKRSLRRPGGPAGRSDEETKQWHCDWKGPYRQLCVKRNDEGKLVKKMVKISKKWKKKYNKKYRKGAFPRGSVFKKDVKARGAHYAARRSPGWIKASSRKKKR